MQFKSLKSQSKAVLRYVGRMVFSIGISRLSSEDEALLRLVLELYNALIEDILPSHPYARRRYISFLSANIAFDVYAWGTSIKEASKLLRMYPKEYESGVRWTRSAFKRLIDCSDAVWTFYSPLFETMDKFFLCPQPCEMRILLQYVDFAIKLNLKSADFSHEEITQYLIFNDDQSRWSYSDRDLSELRAIITSWFGDCDLSQIVPRHGNGATAELKRGSSVQCKYKTLVLDPMLNWWLCKFSKPEEYYPQVPVFHKDPSWRCSVLQAVPKSMTGNRLISKEPTTLQYFQQGISDILYSCLKRAHVPVDSRNQGLSAKLARQGSLHGSFDTIDLSNASDSVSFLLVKEIFRDCPGILPGLIASRSRSVKIVLKDANSSANWQVRSYKFAPMGSGTCFPIECIVFAAICELAKRRRRKARTQYRVFGDDIVCSRALTAEILRLLSDLHFEVNQKKTFYATSNYNFREACGGEFFNGEVVTPLRISRSFHWCGQISSPLDVDVLIGLLNQCFEHQLLSTRRCLNDICRASDPSQWMKKIIFSIDGCTGIRTFPETISNYLLPTRRFRPRRGPDGGIIDFQQSEIKYLTCGTKPCKEASPLLQGSTSESDIEIIRYFETLRRAAAGDLSIMEWNVRYAPEPVSVGPVIPSFSTRWHLLMPTQH